MTFSTTLIHMCRDICFSHMKSNKYDSLEFYTNFTFILLLLPIANLWSLFRTYLCMYCRWMVFWLAAFRFTELKRVLEKDFSECYCDKYVISAWFTLWSCSSITHQLQNSNVVHVYLNTYVEPWSICCWHQITILRFENLMLMQSCLL